MNEISTIENQAKNSNEIFIGDLIEKELRRQERSVSWLARKLNCDRTNVYDIFKRRSIDSELLCNISVALNVNFFDHYNKMFEEKISEQRDHYLHPY